MEITLKKDWARSSKIVCNIAYMKKIIILPNTSKEMITLYHNGLSIKKIAKNFDFSRNTIQRHFKQNKVSIRNQSEVNRKYTINDKFFEEIDTPIKAQVLGLIAADGYNSQDKGTIEITLNEKDYVYLEKIRLTLNSGKPLKFFDYNLLNNENKFTNYYKYWRLTIYNKKISNDLIKYGIIQNKSSCLRPPNNIPEYIEKFFVLGLFDGDGGISVTYRGSCFSPQIMFCGTKEMCFYVKNIIKRETGFDMTITDKTKQSKNHFSISSGGAFKNFKIL